MPLNLLGLMPKLTSKDKQSIAFVIRNLSSSEVLSKYQNFFEAADGPELPWLDAELVLKAYGRDGTDTPLQRGKLRRKLETYIEKAKRERKVSRA